MRSTAPDSRSSLKLQLATKFWGKAKLADGSVLCSRQGNLMLSMMSSNTPPARPNTAPSKQTLATCLCVKRATQANTCIIESNFSVPAIKAPMR